MSDFTDQLSINFTDNELMRIINLYSRRIIDNGLDHYGKRDKRIIHKINQSFNDNKFLELYKKMDYGVGNFTQKKRKKALEEIEYNNILRILENENQDAL